LVSKGLRKIHNNTKIELKDYPEGARPFLSWYKQQRALQRGGRGLSAAQAEALADTFRRTKSNK